MSQESVWDYPRPPRAEATSKRIRVAFAGEWIVDTRLSIRVLETSHPPVYYVPRTHIRSKFLLSSARQTFCEFKGIASHWSLLVGETIAMDAAWSYERPNHGYESIGGYLAFYVNRVDACFVDEERVRPQQGNFYGGWVTSEIVGPFKGGIGSEKW